MKLGTVGWAVLIGAVALGVTIWVGSHYGMVPANRVPTAPDIDEGAEPIEIPPISPNPPYPAVFFENGSKHDFGIIAPGDNGEHIFLIKNNGEAPLILQQGKTTCKCTISEFGGEALDQHSEEKGADGKDADKPARITVEPGKTAEVKLTWKSDKPAPVFGQSASILTNDPQNKIVKFSIGGEVAEEIALTPADAWSVGQLPEGNEPVVVSGNLNSRLVDQFTVEKVESSSEFVKAEAVPYSDEEKTSHDVKSGYSVKVTVLPGVPAGLLREKLTITAMVRDREKTLDVPVVGFRTGPFRILPESGVVWRPQHSMLDFETIDTKTRPTISVPFFVVSMKPEEFKILGIESDVAGLQVRLEDQPDEEGGNTKQYRLVFDFPSGQTLRHNAPPFPKVTVKTNHPDAPTLTLFLKFVSL